jgi:flagellar assembly factor FliW
MPMLETAQLGSLEYQENEVLHFPAGLPGFDEEKEFLLIAHETWQPLVLLQSTRQGGPGLVLAPIHKIDPDYELSLCEGDLKTLDIEGKVVELLRLAVVCFEEEGKVSANLLGPVVLNMDSRRGVQAIRNDHRYSARSPLSLEVETAC